MGQPQHTISLLSEEEINRIFESSLQILMRTGMKIDNDRFLRGLENNGAQVDFTTRVVKFPEALLRNVAAQVRQESASRHSAATAASSVLQSDRGVSWGGGPALFVCDYAKRKVRKATEHDALTIIHLADALPDVSSVSSTMLHYETDLDGKSFNPKLYTLKSIALTAKHTAKIGYAENIYSVPEWEYIARIQDVLFGPDSEASRRTTLLSCCRCVISPLKLERDAADILCHMALNGYPCTVATMAIAGVSAPVTLAGVLAVANAEVLAGWCAVKAVNPKTPCGSIGYLSTMDMRTGTLVYGTPETYLLQVGFQELNGHCYSLPQHLRTLYIDGKLPGHQAALERGLFYFGNLAFEGRAGGSFGFLNRGQTLCCEQALLEIETKRWIDRYQAGFEVNDETIACDLIEGVGIGGTFISEEHTAAHHRSELQLSDVFDRKTSDEHSFEDYLKDDAVVQAHTRMEKLLDEHEGFELDNDKAAEIDSIVNEAERELIEA